MSARIFYFTQAKPLLRRAHVYNIFKTSEALGRASGVPVQIGISIAQADDASRIKKYIADELQVHMENIELLFRKPGAWNAWMQMYRQRARYDVLYYRNPRLFLFAFLGRYFLRKKIILEVHRTPRNFVERIIWKKSFYTAHGLIFITRALQERYTSWRYKSTVVLCNTLDEDFLNQFSSITQSEARSHLKLVLDKFLLVYTGNTLVYDFEPILKAIRGISGINFLIVGVTNRSYMEGLVDRIGVRDRVTLIDRTNLKNIPLYLLAADALVVPVVGYEPGSFPIKIFEYMWAGKPIISFTNDSIKEVLTNGENALLLDTPTTIEWEKCITKILTNKNLAEDMGRRAHEDSSKYTFRKRGEDIYSFIDAL